jgi:uncharacterized membrane protein YdjX (TVP38/TMEM64 family)
MTTARSRRIAALVVLALLVGVVLFARFRLGGEWSFESVRETITEFGPWGPLVFILLVAFRSALLLPSQIVLSLGGLCFGVLGGTLYGALGISLSGVLAFGVTRWLGVEEMRRRVPPGARRVLDTLGSRGGAGLVAVATGYPVGPISMYHIGAALTAMGFLPFLCALALGSTVRAGVYAWFGDALVSGSVAHLAGASAALTAAFLPLLHPGVRRWVRGQFRTEG